MKRKYAMTAGITVLILALQTGCCKRQEAESQNIMLPAAEKVDENNQIEADNNSFVLDMPAEDSRNNSQDTIFIGGKVRSVSQNSFVISRTITDDSAGGSIVMMPEAGSPEEELVTIRCTDATTFELWTIQGGGADIVVKKAAFSDIGENDGLEALGYFDKDEFIAEKVILEIYE